MKKELGENEGEPKPKKKGVEPKQFPRKPTEVPEMPIGEDLESCERNINFLQKEEKNKLVNQCIKKFYAAYLRLLKKRNVIKRFPSLRRPQQVNYRAHVYNIQLHH